MKTVTFVFVLSGFILGISAICDKDECIKITYSPDCESERSYLNCLQSEIDSCQITDNNTSTRATIEAMVAAQKSAMSYAGCCVDKLCVTQAGASVMTVSQALLLMSVVVAYKKI